MKSRPFLLKQPNTINARNKLQEKSDDWETAYPISILGPIIVPWGWVLPRWILPSPKQGPLPKQGKQPSEPPRTPPLRLPRSNLSSLTVDFSSKEGCMLLRKLPLELRQAIFAHVLGNDVFRLITVPWRVIAVPDIEGNVSMSQDYFDSHNLQPSEGPIASSAPNAKIMDPFVGGSGTAILRTCRQIYQEAVDLLYTTNTFVLHDFETFMLFAKEVAPQRLNGIRSLKVHWSPNTSIPYPHDRTPQYDLPLDLEYFWVMVLNLKNLRNLDVHLEAYDLIPLAKREHEASELCRLAPLKRLRGLSSFRLEMGYIQPDSSIRFEPYAPTLRNELMEVVKRPKESEV